MTKEEQRKLIDRMHRMAFARRQAARGNTYEEGRAAGIDDVAAMMAKIIPREEPKKSSWRVVWYENVPHHVVCENCGCVLYYQKNEPVKNTPRYCPDCGAQMKEG